MKLWAQAILGLTVSGLVAAPSFGGEKTALEKTVEARQGDMKIRAFNVGILAAMAKGERPYDAEAAATAARNIELASMMNNRAMWPPGSGSDNRQLKTEALPAIWEEGSKIGDKARAFKLAAEELAEEAGGGLAAMKPKFAALGKSCKGCHEDYREKKN